LQKRLGCDVLLASAQAPFLRCLAGMQCQLGVVRWQSSVHSNGSVGMCKVPLLLVGLCPAGMPGCYSPNGRTASTSTISWQTCTQPLSCSAGEACGTSAQLGDAECIALCIHPATGTSFFLPTVISHPASHGHWQLCVTRRCPSCCCILLLAGSCSQPSSRQAAVTLPAVSMLQEAADCCRPTCCMTGLLHCCHFGLQAWRSWG
jgi:hypothetical protein